MLELLATVDPFAAILGSLWLFAAGMFPVGFMLGSTCSACCNPCTLCATGTLPSTVTLKIDGFSEGQEPGPWLCNLQFSSCFGSGAAGHVTAPGGIAATDKGPIAAVAVTNGGSGYAVLGRVAPTLTITGSGTGATFTPTFSVSQDACGIERWSVASISAAGGTGYTDGESLTITAATGDTQVSAASAKLFIGKLAPELTLPGNATGTVQTQMANDGTFAVSAVTVTSGGSGYTDGQLLYFGKAADDVILANATAFARVIYSDNGPRDANVIISSAEGTGAVLEPVWELLPSNQWPAPHQKTFRLASMTVVNGGSGYADYDLIYIDFADADDGAVEVNAYIDADIVGPGGEIQQVHVATEQDPSTPAPAGEFRSARSDELGSVQLGQGGSYYKDSPNSRTVLVTAAGSYYREDPNEPPYVASVTVGVSQTPPSAGSGANLSAVIDDNTASPTFGQVTGVTINNSGDDYLAYEWCESYLQGVEVVLPGSECFFLKEDCSRSFEVEYRGPSAPPLVRIEAECDYGDVVQYNLEATTNVANCSALSFTAEDASGRSVTVSAGGQATQTTCSDCVGFVTVNGVSVPVNTGAYVLVSVDPGITNVTLPIPNGIIFQNYRSYGVARATAQCVPVTEAGNVLPGSPPELGFPTRHEIVVFVEVNVGLLSFVGIAGTPIPPGDQSRYDAYDDLVVGQQRFVDPWFLPYSGTIGGAFEHRSRGPVRGDACVGTEWRALRSDNLHPFPDNPSQPPSFALLAPATRVIVSDNNNGIACGPV